MSGPGPQEVEMKKSATALVLNSLTRESAKEVKKGKLNTPSVYMTSSWSIGPPDTMAREVEMKKSSATEVLNSLAGASAKEVKKDKLNIPRAFTMEGVMGDRGIVMERMMAMGALRSEELKGDEGVRTL